MELERNEQRKTIHVWLGGVAKKDRFEKLSKIGANQYAANNMQLLYIDGIEKNINDKMIVISSQFIPYYFKNKVGIFHGNQNDNWIDISFINFPVIKQITKSMNIAKEAKKVIKNNLNCDFVFYIYSMTTPLMRAAKTICYYRKKYKLNIKIIQIVPDLPEYMNFTKKSIIWKLAKKLDIKYLYYLKKYIDKFILFSPYMAEKLSISNKSFIVIEGMVDHSFSIKDCPKERIIMYAGGIKEEYGVYDLIDAFAESNLNGYELHLYGPCTDIDKLNHKIKTYKNIKYFGSVSRDIILKKESCATLLVNPRKPNQDFTIYSFPSKTMEYLLSGTPVLMYKLKSIPKEYDNYLYYIDEKENQLKKMIFDICNRDIMELNKQGKLSREFVLLEKNNVVQCKKIIDFIYKEKK